MLETAAALAVSALESGIVRNGSQLLCLRERDVFKWVLDVVGNLRPCITVFSLAYRIDTCSLQSLSWFHLSTAFFAPSSWSYKLCMSSSNT